jgi:hypothetical protein
MIKRESLIIFLSLLQSLGLMQIYEWQKIVIQHEGLIMPQIVNIQ